MNSLSLEIFKKHLLNKNVEVLRAIQAQKTRKENFLKDTIERMIEINNLPPTISSAGAHAPVDGYMFEDKEYLAGQFIPYSFKEDDDFRVSSNNNDKIWTAKIKLPVSLLQEVQDFLNELHYESKVELGSKWNEDVEVAYFYIKTSPAYVNAIQEAALETKKAQIQEQNKHKGVSPEGKQTITATVISIKFEEGYYGITEKAMMKLENGSTVWGTLPKALQDAVSGDVVEFTATFTQAECKTHSFYKRPSKAKILELEI